MGEDNGLLLPDDTEEFREQLRTLQTRVTIVFQLWIIIYNLVDLQLQTYQQLLWDR